MADAFGIDILRAVGVPGCEDEKVRVIDIGQERTPLFACPQRTRMVRRLVAPKRTQQRRPGSGRWRSRFAASAMGFLATGPDGPNKRGGPLCRRAGKSKSNSVEMASAPADFASARRLALWMRTKTTQSLSAPQIRVRIR